MEQNLTLAAFIRVSRVDLVKALRESMEGAWNRSKPA